LRHDLSFFEFLLLMLGLALQNAFWSVNFSDPHKAVSFDEMHSNDHGLGGKHLFPEAKRHISLLGRKAVEIVEAEYVNLLIYV
jgi:hypothetical protein